jgi:hypothetical protein
MADSTTSIEHDLARGGLIAAGALVVAVALGVCGSRCGTRVRPR